MEPVNFSSLIAETKLEKPEQELSGQPGSPKQPFQPSVPAPQQECQPQEQEPRKRDEGRERRPSQEKRRDMDRHQELPSQREAEEAPPQDGGGSRSEWHRVQFWICLHSMRPFAERAAFTETSGGCFHVVQIVASSNDGLSSSKGAGVLPLGKLIQGKLASGCYS